MRERDDRHLRLVHGIANVSEEEAARKFLTSTVIIGWPAELERSRLGRSLVLTTSNLISRFCPKIYFVRRSGLATETITMLRAIDQSKDATFETGDAPPDDSVATVWLGGGVPQLESVTTAASARGWVAHVSSGDDFVMPILSPSNVPFGTLAAAAFAAAEVFKRLLPPRPGRGHLFPRTAFSTFTFRANDESPGPDLPDRISIDATLLAGIGAVGQAFIHVLAHVPGTSGDLIAVDKENVDDPTNSNRYCLAEDADVAAERPKTSLAVRGMIESNVRVVPHQRDLTEVLRDINAGTVPWPRSVVSALDNDEPRYALQLLWPDLLIEGATGDTLLQLFRHYHADGTACLRCIHEPQEDGELYEKAISRQSGLTVERVLQALGGENTQITETDVASAADAVKPLLRERLGKDLCGTLAEIERFESPSDTPVQPAVSFTSYLAGLFACAELIRNAAGLPAGLSGRYQLDPIATLEPGEPWEEEKRTDCYCVERAATVEIYRNRMRRC